MQGLFLILCIFAFSQNLIAQDFRTPVQAQMQLFPKLSDYRCNNYYSRPGVKNRVIWGQLVPYNKVWRTGANEVTSITFSDPVKINGNPLPAGTYGIHTIPAENEWTFLFSGNTKVAEVLILKKVMLS